MFKGSQRRLYGDAGIYIDPIGTKCAAALSCACPFRRAAMTQMFFTDSVTFSSTSTIARLVVEPVRVPNKENPFSWPDSVIFEILRAEPLLQQILPLRNRYVRGCGGREARAHVGDYLFQLPAVDPVALARPKRRKRPDD